MVFILPALLSVCGILNLPLQWVENISHPVRGITFGIT